MRDKIIECTQCNREFNFTVSEQAYYRKMGFDEPRRCVDCRKHKTKASHNFNPKMSMDKKKHFRLKYDNDD